MKNIFIDLKLEKNIKRRRIETKKILKFIFKEKQNLFQISFRS